MSGRVGLTRVWAAMALKVMVCGSWVTLKFWSTSGAGVNVPLPVWLALTEHCPAASKVTVVPATVQTRGVGPEKATLRPEVAVAATMKDPALRVRSARLPKVIVWLAWLTANVCVTAGAAAKLAVPDLLDEMEH